MIRMLIVVEGEVDEVEIFKKLFSIIGFTVIESTKNGDFTHITNVLGDNVVYLIPGPKSKIQSVLETFDVNTMDLSLFFGISETIPLNYIVYDVDITNYERFSSIIPNFCTPQEGLVLLSNPCIEVIADEEYLIHNDKPSLYKGVVRQQVLSKNKMNQNDSLLSYIINNVLDLFIEQIKRNIVFFSSNDVIDHVLSSYSKIGTNQFSFNPNSYSYTKLFTVIYVVLADIFDVSRELDNAELLIKEIMKVKSTFLKNES